MQVIFVLVGLLFEGIWVLPTVLRSLVVSLVVLFTYDINSANIFLWIEHRHVFIWFKLWVDDTYALYIAHEILMDVNL